MGMMETITLNLKKLKRLLVLNRVNDGKMAAAKAAELLGWSERHVRRMLARYRTKGAEALAHGNRGRESERRIQQVQRSRIVSLAQGPYAGVNQQHLSELQNEREQISVSRSTLRRILADAGMASLHPIDDGDCIDCVGRVTGRHAGPDRRFAPRLARGPRATDDLARCNR